MPDKISAEQRSGNMRAIRSKDTKPEMIVRRLVHAMGYRYRLHRKDISGKPDMVFMSRHCVIFVHGCFWHQHPNLECKDARFPKSNLDYWQPKLERNIIRDKQNMETLRAEGWNILVIWDCETKNHEQLSVKIRNFLGN